MRAVDPAVFFPSLDHRNRRLSPTMEVIPLTLALSLLLSLTFIALFLREFTRPRRAGAEHDSLLPLEPDFQPARATFFASVAPEAGSSTDSEHHHHRHDHGANREGCAKSKTGSGCCDSCRRRRDERSARVVGPVADQPVSVANDSRS
jgi:hypothetical protein